MSDIFGGVEPPRWLQAISRPPERGELGRLLGTTFGGIANALQRDPDAKPDPETGEQPRKGFLQGLTEARMNQANPIWKLGAQKAEVDIRSGILQNEMAFQAFQSQKDELKSFQEVLPNVMAYSKLSDEEVLKSPMPNTGQSKRAWEMANQVKDRAWQSVIKKETADTNKTFRELQLQQQKDRSAVEASRLRVASANNKAFFSQLETIGKTDPAAAAQLLKMSKGEDGNVTPEAMDALVKYTQEHPAPTTALTEKQIEFQVTSREKAREANEKVISNLDKSIEAFSTMNQSFLRTYATGQEPTNPEELNKFNALKRRYEPLIKRRDALLNRNVQLGEEIDRFLLQGQPGGPPSEAPARAYGGGHGRMSGQTPLPPDQQPGAQPTQAAIDKMGLPADVTPDIIAQRATQLFPEIKSKHPDLSLDQQKILALKTAQNELILASQNKAPTTPKEVQKTVEERLLSDLMRSLKPSEIAARDVAAIKATAKKAGSAWGSVKKAIDKAIALEQVAGEVIGGVGRIRKKLTDEKEEITDLTTGTGKDDKVLGWRDQLSGGK